LISSNLVTRVLTAALAAPLLLLLLFLGSPDSWYLLVLAAAALATFELLAMTHPHDRVARGLGTLMSVAASVVLYFHTSDPRALLALVFVLPIAGLFVTLWRLGEIETSALRALASIAAPLYVGGLLTCLALLRRDTGELGPYYVLLALKISWLGDTGGYFVGRYFGDRKLYPRVSPKKTLAGLWGSMLGAVLGCVVAHFWYLRDVPLLELVLLGAVGGVLGQMGDLAESMLKRSTGIKDSGTLIPGHGGMLDRIDALLIVSPLLYLYTLFFRASVG
jgi:phosphatidate cytidylyltransferase